MAKSYAQVKGFKELNQMLESLTDNKFRKAALKEAAQNAMKPVLFDAKANAPTLEISEKNPSGVVAGQLKNDIKMKTRYIADPNSIISKSGKLKKNSSEITVSVETGRATKDYAAVVEFGRPEKIAIRSEVFGRKTKEFEAIVPKVTPRPYLQPAFYKHSDKMADKFGKHMYKSIQKQIARQKRLRGK